MTSTAPIDDVATRPSLQLISELEQTLYREARLLDQERLDEWMEMLAEDLFYYMPAVETRYRNDRTDTLGDVSRMAYYNDDLDMIFTRIERLRTGTAWSEDPRTRYQHLITNIEVALTENPDEYKVYSNFFAFRSRNERDEDKPLVGCREDLWRHQDGNYLLAKRILTPKWNILLSKNLNLFL
ncbi:3-phenylpropionate/cinnamic acid dioxygenase subunit beta [Rhodococcus opacus]|uniref:3-phenylpropionate dioxygenase n=2 Tax=Rhodococcus TaxID=1827 RepID=A0A076F2D1_RHOOP|nr:3-phenylpropionate/cinnamic acid dioxygenase subunit beta [Rhodococcus opacus]ACL31216.1 ring hydroxylating dioxygenase beta subunit [Rhodococcus sp. TFB]ACL31222.1 ring hydroxylating dioxygenase beta subunit [Rhodococcus sp. TFB]AII11492.1 3-phenylpropionate dioxygenase [Rhodococcus opacus]